MPIDTSVPLSPGWWLRRLMQKLADRRPQYEKLENYYNGTAVIAPLNPSKQVRDAYRRLMCMSSTNFAELVVEAVRERMNPAGFRTGADGDDLVDKEAWRIWQANELDADSGLVHRASLVTGDAYVIVGGVDAETQAPVITPESPCEVITEHDPVRRRKVVAAAKVFRDDVAGLDKALLFLPGVVFKAARKSDGEMFTPDLGGWEWMPGSPEALPSKVVPVVRFANRSGLGGYSQGEFEPHLPLLDRIMYDVLERLEIATMQAFRQRAVKGDLPQRDSEGNEIDYDNVFSADPGALWQLGSTAEIWESGQVDLGPIRAAIRDDVQDLAAVTRTPLFYLTPDSANGSAEGASLAREGLVFKTTDRLVQAGESWERVMRLAFLFAGDTERASDSEVIWSSPERFSLAERYDAAVKAIAAGVPWRTVMRVVLQHSPQEIDRMEAERAADALLNPLPLPPNNQSPPDEEVA